MADTPIPLRDGLRPEAVRDAEWVSRAQAGDAAAFRALFDAYQQPVYHIALRMLGNRDDAADLAQETFVRAYRQLHTLRAGATFSSWIRAIVTNLCRDHLKRVRPTTYSLDAPPPGATELDSWELPSPTADGAQQLLDGEFRQMLAEGIGGLSPDHRAVIVLHHLEGVPVDEISRMLRIPIGTVKSRLGRARAELKRVLGDYLQSVLPE